MRKKNWFLFSSIFSRLSCYSTNGFSTHYNVILIKESNLGQWIMVVDVIGAYILYHNGEFNKNES
jgi:hypothetical protein